VQLVLMVTARCNASCTHCSTSCGPSRTEHLSFDSIQSVIDQAAALSSGRQLEISITGGEPFLNLDQLRETIRYGSDRGAFMTCVSNGYWASSPEKALKILRQMQEAGLKLIAISTSRFHEEFIKRRRVYHALSAARAIGLECVMKFVQTTADEDLREVRREARAAGADRVELLPLMPTVRSDGEVAETDYPRKPGLPKGVCPAAIINVSESGEAYMCCTPGAFTPFFALGRIPEKSLKDIRGKFLLGDKQQVLRRYGPTFFAKAIADSGEGDRLRTAYANTCDLCTHIAGDPILSEIAEAAAQRFAIQQIETILSTARTSHAIN
jgi:MoaA/NifB/PqqE/SkfB family radical SAM enzyme